MNTHRALTRIPVNFGGPCLWVVSPSISRQWFGIFLKCLLNGFSKWFWYPWSLGSQGEFLPWHEAYLAPWVPWLLPMLTCHLQHFMSVTLGPLWVRMSLQHKRTPPRKNRQSVEVGSSSQGIYWKHLIFSTVAICSSFHANGIIWSMNALGKGKRCIKSVKAHSYKWVGRFTTFSPESNLSAIRTVYETGRSELWLNYT